MSENPSFDTGKLEQLAEILARFELTRLEYSNVDETFVLEKNPAPTQSSMVLATPSTAVTPATGDTTGTPVALASSKEPVSSVDTLTADITGSATAGSTSSLTQASHQILAPLVGVAYRAKEPDALPFVEVGSEVEEGCVLCLIEAMKMFSEIKAPVAGRVTGIFFEDTTLVEHGALLFTLD